VKIGCMVPLTGKGAEWGQTAKISMEIATEEINAKGGIGGLPIELICYDTQTLEAEGLKIVSRLVERDNVDFVVGPIFSNILGAIHKPVVDAGKFLISPNAGPSTARDGAGHFIVEIESEDFSGRSRLERHR
ncbi:MAG: ABC transporter substrate-binding protein, partial [Synechococcales cyanobacterium CRU_2_2]|nr:ABC transporter substrate-binding protein [Synechococcales cyanobacterium CRU_2_2]